MLFCYYEIVCLAGFLQLCYCQRRLVSGIDSIAGKKYMVYFVQSSVTRNFQNSWVCGGAIVTPTQILTTASCLTEAENIYAIAGYKKYITAKNIDRDDCTRRKKQRVVKILIPTGYNLDYENPVHRKNINIGIAVVEKPYDFSDSSYLIHCSYKPQSILVNFETIHDTVNSHAVTLGWGVQEKTPEFIKDSKYQLLQETSTMIVDKNICTTITDTKDFVQLIHKYHLCGTINLQEMTEDSVFETLSFDAYKHSKLDNSGFKDNFGFRRGYNEEDNSELREKTEDITFETQMHMNSNENYETRRALHQDICQNNLGSPLIKWVNDKEVIIGITSNTNLNGKCNGPFLYVSTAASSNIIMCLLETNSIMRKLCSKKISDGPYEIQEIEILWPNYNESKILEPMLLIQRAVLDKLSPLIPRATIKYNNRGAYTTSIKKFNIQSRYSLKHAVTQQNIFQRAQKFEKNAYQRSESRPLISRPQYDIDSKHQKEQQYKPVSEELVENVKLNDNELPKPQFPPLLQRPQFDIDDIYQEKNQEPLSEEVTTTQQEFLRPQLNLQSDFQKQLLKTGHDLKSDNQREYTLPQNQNYQSPSYNQYDSQKQAQYGSQLEHNNKRIPEIYYSLMRERYEPHLMQVYGSPTVDPHNPAREQQYYSPSNQQEYESLVRQLNKKAAKLEQNEPQSGQSYVSPVEVKYTPHSNHQNNPSTKLPYELPIRVQQDLADKQKDTAVYVASQMGQQNEALGYHQLNQESEKKDYRHVSQPPIQISAHSLEPKKSMFQQSEIMYDFSFEQHFSEPNLAPKQEFAQSPFKKPPAQFSNLHPNLQPHTSLIQSPYQKLLQQNNTTTLSDDDTFSFDELFAQLQDLPSEPQTTARPDQTQKYAYEQFLQDRTFDEPYKENDRYQDMHIPRVESPLSRDEVMIRPQIPMNNHYV